MTEKERADRIAGGTRQRFIENIALALVAVVAVVALGVALHVAQARAVSAESSAVSLAQQVQAACESQGSLDIEGRDLCDQADAVVEDPAAPPVPQDGKDGKDAPPLTSAQVQGAVEALCSRETCAVPPTMAQVTQAVTTLLATGDYDGKDGDDGKDAPLPDPGELQALATQAVLAYCESGPQCDPGQDGDDGPTADDVQAMVAIEVGRQVGAAVAEHCAKQPGGTCEGGVGAAGSDGVGIADVECPEPDNDWIYTFTDGTTKTVAGPCRVDPIIPTPEEG